MGLGIQMNDKYILGDSRTTSREDDIFEPVICSGESLKQEQEGLPSSRLASCPLQVSEVGINLTCVQALRVATEEEPEVRTG